MTDTNRTCPIPTEPNPHAAKATAILRALPPMVESVGKLYDLAGQLAGRPDSAARARIGYTRMHVSTALDTALIEAQLAVADELRQLRGHLAGAVTPPRRPGAVIV